MTSTFTWLDYSEDERRQMLDVIDSFGEQETRDELGLGSVRDAFADLMFPGTSTIQTRAKYFLFVPWIYRRLEERRTPSSKVAVRARKMEIELAAELDRVGGAGVIGRVAKEKLQRLPSAIYWQGLLRWGIRLFPGSIDEYHRSLDRFYAAIQAKRSSRHEYDGESTDEADLHNWHPGLPPPAEKFPANESMSLRFDEAEYLRERILTNCSQSVLAHLLKLRINGSSSPFIWDLADQLPPHLHVQVRHGQNFSETIHGAQLLYNLMIAELRSWDSAAEKYRSELSLWWQRVSARVNELRSWDRQDFWQTVRRSNPRVSPRAQQFIRSWIDLVVGANELSTVLEGAESRQLVEHREVQLKRKLSRLHNDRARERWNGAAGAAQLDLRWTSARSIVNDILEGLEEASNA